MPLTLKKVRGSCRARYDAEPFDQGTVAEISRRSPRSADPGSYSSQSLTPPPLGIKDNSRCVRRLSNNQQSHTTIATSKKY